MRLADCSHSISASCFPGITGGVSESLRPVQLSLFAEVCAQFLCQRNEEKSNLEFGCCATSPSLRALSGGAKGTRMMGTNEGDEPAAKRLKTARTLGD